MHKPKWLLSLCCTLFTIIGTTSLSIAQTGTENKQLNNFIEYLITTTRKTEVNYKLVIENANYILQVSYNTYNNYRYTTVDLPVDAINKSAFLTRRVNEMEQLKSQYNDSRAGNKTLEAPKVIIESGLLQEYIDVSDNILMKMNENAEVFEKAAKSQHELVTQIVKYYLGTSSDSIEKFTTNPDLKSIAPALWDTEQSLIKEMLAKQYKLYIKIVKEIEKWEGVPYNKTFAIANEQLIYEDNEKRKAEELERTKKALGGYKVSALFTKNYKVFPFIEGYYHGNINVTCKQIDNYKKELAAKGFDDKAFAKLKTLCGQFNEQTPKETLQKLVGYYITDIHYDNGENQKALIWIPKEENAFLEKEQPIFGDAEGFIMLCTPTIQVTGKINVPENNAETLLMARLFRNAENKCTLPMNGYMYEVNGYYKNEVQYYLETLAGNNTALDSLFKEFMNNPSLPFCIKGIQSAHDPKDKRWKKCDSKISKLIAYKVLQFNEPDPGTFKRIFYDVYWVPGDENQSANEDVKPLKDEGYLLLVHGANNGHFIEKLKREIY